MQGVRIGGVPGGVFVPNLGNNILIAANNTPGVLQNLIQTQLGINVTVSAGGNMANIFGYRFILRTPPVTQFFQGLGGQAVPNSVNTVYTIRSSIGLGAGRGVALIFDPVLPAPFTETVANDIFLYGIDPNISPGQLPLGSADLPLEFLPPES